MTMSNNNMLSSGFTYEVDQISESKWTDIVLRFTDATIYQTWSYADVRSKRRRPIRLVLKCEGEIVAAVQARIYTPPFLKAGMAYVHWGPMWRLKNTKDDDENLRQMLHAIRREMAIRRGLYVKVLPNIYDTDPSAQMASEVFDSEGYKWNEPVGKVLLIDLAPDLETLRKGLKQKWRNQLNGAEKKGLKLIEGYGDELMNSFISIYGEMRDRKGIAGIDMEEFKTIYRLLPEAIRPRIVLCELDGAMVAGGIFSTLGETAIYLHGATTNAGLVRKANGANLIHWRFIQWLKDNGFTHYDLASINPECNRGTYHFKAGLCGKNGGEARRIGEFTVPGGFLSNCFVALGEKLRTS